MNIWGVVLARVIFCIFPDFSYVGAHRCTKKGAWDCFPIRNRLSGCSSKDSAVNCINTEGAAIARAFELSFFEFSLIMDMSVHVVVPFDVPEASFIDRIVQTDFLQQILL
jgi:hypothetical protein